jgi:hypothetical protein
MHFALSDQQTVRKGGNMEWWLGAVVVLLLVVLLMLGIALKDALRLNRNLVSRIEKSSTLAMSVIAREVCNELMQRDHKEYRRRFENMHRMWSDLKSEGIRAKTLKLREITSKYPLFSDFDVLGTSAHVFYADGFSWKSYDELWNLYEAVRLYEAINRDFDVIWKMNGGSISDAELEHLNSYCSSYENTMLLAHLYKARDFLNSASEPIKRITGTFGVAELILETEDYSFYTVPHFLEIQIGVHVKALGLYGIWGLFVENDVSFTSFYIADEKFNNEKLLIDKLNMRMCIDCGEYSSIEKLVY